MSKQRRRRNRSENKTARLTAQRHLLAERLEDRLLLAANVNPWHNVFVATDVDGNYSTTPMDALWIINDLNDNGARELDQSLDLSQQVPFYDTNNDGNVSAIDALQVINRLNSGEGEPGDWVGFRLEAQDLNGNPLPNNTVKVGDEFRLQLYTQDLGGNNADATVRIPTGVFAAFVDIGYNDESLFTIVWGETQRIELEPTTTGGTYTLTLDGEETAPITVSPSIFQSTANLLAGLEGLLNVEQGDVRVTNRGEAGGNPFIWDVQFDGQFSNIDVPLMTGDFQNLSNGTGSSEITERFPPDPLNANTFRSAWEANDLYADSLTAWPWQSEKDGDQTADEFDEVGGVQGNTTFPAFRNPPIDPALEYPVLQADFIADAPGDLVLTNNLAEMIASYVLVYGTNTPIPEQLIDFGDPLTVTIIQPVNAEDDTFPLPGNDILEESVVQLDVLANDFLADPATGPMTIDPNGFVDPPDHGTVSVVGGQVQYTPDTDFFGVDEFTYTVTDINGDSDTARVTVTVTNVNDQPVAVDDDIATIGSVVEDSGPNTLDVLANDNGGGGPLEEGETVTVSAVTQPPNGIAAVGPNGGSVIYTPADNFFGTDTFTYTITDGGLTDTATVTVTVTPVNDAPIAMNDSRVGIPEDSPGVTIDVLVNDNGGGGPLEENEPISVISVTQPTNGEVQIGAGGANVVYIPDANFFGTETFEYTISDGDLTATAEVTVTVDNINDPPVANDDSLFVDEFSADNVLEVLDNDTPGADTDIWEMDDLTITVVTPASFGTVSVAADNLTLIYTPDPAVFGPETDTFVYTMTDGEFTDTATVTVEIEPIIRPRARDDQETVLEDSDAADNVFDVTDNDLFNIGANPLPIIITTPPLHGTATVVNDFFVQYEPDDNYFGRDSFEYQIDDDFTGGPSDPDIGLVEITVENVNDPPVANDDTEMDIPEDSINYSIDVLANDETGPLGPPAEADNLLLVRATQPANGQVQLSGDLKTILYTPNRDFFGSDSFTYTMTDGEFESSATVDVVVDNINDPPVANDDLKTVQEDSGVNVVDVLVNDNAGPGGESEAIQVTQVGGASHGVVSIGNGGLTVTYRPTDDYFGSDSFSYTITDGQFQDVATVNVTVNNVNDDPTANPDDALALAGFADQEIKGVLDNDSVGPDNEIPFDTLTILGLGPNVDNVITTDQGGTAKLIGQQIFYTPADGFVDDIDTFTYTIGDGNGGTSEPAVISVDVVDAVPSDISGKAYLDVNNNGQWDPQELLLAGVEVTREGVNIRGEYINETVQTGPDGVFRFKDVLPNEVGDPNGYTLRAATPEYARDGSDAMIDSIVDDDYNPGTAFNDEFRGIELGLFGTDRAEDNYMFGERGLATEFISLSQYLSSTRTGLVAATTMAGDDYWFSLMQGWEGAHSVHVQLANDLMTAELTIKDGAGQSHTKTISYRDYYVAGKQDTGEYMVYFNGSAADFGFDLAQGDLAQADVPAEGEVPMDAEQLEMLAARGQRDFEKAVDLLFGGDHLA